MVECFSFNALSAVLAYRVDIMKDDYLFLFAGIKWEYERGDRQRWRGRKEENKREGIKKKRNY